MAVAEFADFATDVRLGSPLLWYVDHRSQEHVPISILILVFVFYNDRLQKPPVIFHKSPHKLVSVFRAGYIGPIGVVEDIRQDSFH